MNNHGSKELNEEDAERKEHDIQPGTMQVNISDAKSSSTATYNKREMLGKPR